jgi:multiple sugar transport system substrate-binding protein
VTFEAELIAALARGAGPDMVLLPQDLIVKQMDKFYPIPFKTYSERLFRDSFIEEGELFLIPEGVIGLPLLVDPMVMYWNRSIISNAGIALPPASWTEIYAMAPKVIRKDGSGNVTQALLAFGAVNNVTHAKEIISLLALQAGSALVARDGNNYLRSTFADQNGAFVAGEQAVNFFTEFANPVKPAYSWNRSLPSDRNMFLSGKLALYFGYASELPGIRLANPNLNFDVAPVPQIQGNRITYGTMQAFAFLKASPNLGAAYTAAQVLTSEALQKEWIKVSGYPPVRRSLVSEPQGSAYASVFYDSALMSRGWLDPNPVATERVFSELVESVTSGRVRTSEAVRNAGTEIDNLLRSNI